MTSYTITVVPTVATFGRTVDETAQESNSYELPAQELRSGAGTTSYGATTNIFANGNEAYSESNTEAAASGVSFFNSDGEPYPEADLEFSASGSVFESRQFDGLSRLESTNFNSDGQQQFTTAASSFSTTRQAVTHSISNVQWQATTTEQTSANSTTLNVVDGQFVTQGTTVDIWTTKTSQTESESFYTITYEDTIFAYGNDVLQPTTTSSGSSTGTAISTISALGGTQTGFRQTATVVILDATEAAYVATEPVQGYSAWIGDVAQIEPETIFTVLPSFKTFAGGITSNAATSEESYTTAIYTVLSRADTTLTYANFSHDSLPLTDITETATTLTTGTITSELTEFHYTGGSVVTTTVKTTSTHEGQIADLTYQATHTQTATRLTSVSVEVTEATEIPFTGSQTNVDGEISGASGGLTRDESVEWQRTATIGLSLPTQFNHQGIAADSFFKAAALAGKTDLASVFGADLSISWPGVSLKKSQTAYIPPLGTWLIENGRASADARGVTVTVSSGSNTASSSASWTQDGLAIITRAVQTAHRLNPGGLSPAGGGITYSRLPGAWRTTGPDAVDGELDAGTAQTFVSDSEARVAYSRALVAVAGNSRYFTTTRHTEIVNSQTAIF